MGHKKYYLATVKAAEDWQKMWTPTLMTMATMAKTVQPPYARMLQGLKNAVADLRATQRSLNALASSVLPAEAGLSRCIREANTQMSDVLASLKPFQEMTERVRRSQDMWARSIVSSAGVSSGALGVAGIIARDFTHMANSALLAQKCVAHIALLRIPRAGDFSSHWSAPLFTSVADMATSYRELWNGLAADRTKFLAVPSYSTRDPSVEMYLALHQLGATVCQEKVNLVEQEFLVEVEPTEEYLYRLVESVDAELVHLYRGAVEAVRSSNADRARHVCTSLRELVTQILHRLAPDELFFEWNQNHCNIVNNRPTRKGRLLYICRNINHGPFATFLERDVEAALEFLQLFQKGTHTIKQSFDGKQLGALMVRMECLLYFLIKISRGEEYD